MLHLLEDLAIVGRVRTPPPALRGVTAAAACACTHVYDIFGRVGMYGSMNASTHQSHVLWGLHAQSGAREGTRCLPRAPERERGACLLPLLTKRDMRCDPAEELADRDSGRSCDLSDASEPAREWLRDSADGLTGREQRPRAPVRTPRTPAGALLGAASRWQLPKSPAIPPTIPPQKSCCCSASCATGISLAVALSGEWDGRALGQQGQQAGASTALCEASCVSNSDGRGSC